MKPVKLKRMISCLLLVLLLNALPVAAREDVADPAKSPVIRMTPPAPAFDENMRLAELANRRVRVGQAIGEKGIVILFSTEPRVYTNDVDYEYRQENNLYYLTNLKQKGATLVLTPGNATFPAILFLPRRDPRAETWTGHMYSPEEASQVSGIKEIWEASEFEPFMRALRNRQPYRPKPEKILLSSSSAAGENAIPNSLGFDKIFAAALDNNGEIYLLVPGAGDSMEYRQEQLFASEWSKSASGYSIKNVTPIFAEMRLRKSALELALLQHAIDITTEAHERAWVAAAEANLNASVVLIYKALGGGWEAAPVPAI